MARGASRVIATSVPKRPIHLRSADGSGLPLLLRLHTEGHPVSMWTKAPLSVHVGRGLVSRSAQPPPGALVLFDATGLDAQAAAFRRAGHLVIGGNVFERALELDRAKGARIMRDSGIRIPDTFPFHDIATAIKFLDDRDGAWFVKVSGDTVESETFDAPDAETMIRYLTWLRTRGRINPFELQQKIDGIEISCNGWFNGRAFVPPFDMTIEEKKFLNHDLGPRTGCESCVVWHAADTALAAKSVMKIVDVLARERYVGSIDLNMIVPEDGEPRGLEWTARIGFDSTPAWMRLFSGDLGEQLEDFASGTLSEWEPSGIGTLSGTVRISIPPYPTFDERLLTLIKGTPLDERLIDDPSLDVVDVMVQDGDPVSAGSSGIVATVGGTHNDVRTLRDDLLRPTAFSLNIPNKQFRTHIFKRFESDVSALATHGLSGLRPVERPRDQISNTLHKERALS